MAKFTKGAVQALQTTRSNSFLTSMRRTRSTRPHRSDGAFRPFSRDIARGKTSLTSEREHTLSPGMPSNPFIGKRGTDRCRREQMVKANRNGTVRSNDRTTGPGESSTLPKPYGRCNRRSVGVARKDHGTVVRNARQEAHARSTDRGIGHCTSDGSLGHSSGDRRGNPPPTRQGIIVRRLPIPITDNENGLRRGVNLRKGRGASTASHAFERGHISTPQRKQQWKRPRLYA